MADYVNDRSPRNKKKIEKTQANLNEFVENNQEILGSGSEWFNTGAAYVPQMLNQLDAGVKGGAVGGGTALLLGQLGPQIGIPEEIITVPTAAKAGYTAAVTKHSYDRMKGAAFYNLVQLGVDEETALNIAKDEALISASIEAIGTLANFHTLGSGKLFGLLSKEGIKKTAQAVAKKGATEAAESAFKKIGNILAKYGLNILGEVAEESAQEVVSIGSEMRAGFTKRDWGEDAARVGQAAKQAAQVSSLLVGADALGRTAVQGGQTLTNPYQAARTAMGKNTEQITQQLTKGNYPTTVTAQKGTPQAIPGTNITYTLDKQAGEPQIKFSKPIDEMTPVEFAQVLVMADRGELTEGQVADGNYTVPAPQNIRPQQAPINAEQADIDAVQRHGYNERGTRYTVSETPQNFGSNTATEIDVIPSGESQPGFSKSFEDMTPEEFERVVEMAERGELMAVADIMAETDNPYPTFQVQGTDVNDEGIKETMEQFLYRHQTENHDKVWTAKDEIYACKPTPPEQYSKLAQDALQEMERFGFDALVYDGVMQAHKYGKTIDVRGEASRIADGSIVISNIATLPYKDIVAHEFCHRELFKNNPVMVEHHTIVQTNINFSSKQFHMVSERIANIYYGCKFEEIGKNDNKGGVAVETGKKGNFDLLYEELTAFISGQIHDDPVLAEAEYGSMFHDFSFIKESWDATVHALVNP